MLNNLPLLDVKALSFFRESQPIFEDITFSLQKGECISFVGPSGCGKSTLLSLVRGLLPAKNGQVLVHGRSVSLRESPVGLMLQDYGLLPWKTAQENIELGLRLKKKSCQLPQELLQKLGINTLLHKYPSELSGGQKQRVALARLLVLDPELLLLDEPFSATDALIRERLQILVRDTCLDNGVGYVLVTHDLLEALVMSQRIYFLTSSPSRIAEVYYNHKFSRMLQSDDLYIELSELKEKVKRIYAIRNSL